MESNIASLYCRLDNLSSEELDKLFKIANKHCLSHEKLVELIMKKWLECPIEDLSKELKAIYGG